MIVDLGGLVRVLGLPLMRGSLIVSLSLALLVSTIPAEAAPLARTAAQTAEKAAGESDTASVSVADATAAALASAKSSGAPVPVAALSSQFEAVSANPDGASLTTDLTASPVRILVDGKWQGLDMALESVDGAVAPRVAGNSVSLAAGGAGGSLVSVSMPKDLLAQSAASFSGDDTDAEVGRAQGSNDPGIGLQWPSGSIPSPKVEGEDARYPGIASGVDAVVSATARGFAVDLSAAQALESPTTVSLPLSLTGGLKVKATAATSGEIAVLSSKGEQVGTIGPFVVSDSSVDPETGEARLVKPVSVTVVSTDQGSVLQVPVKTFKDPDAVFPVKVSGLLGLGLDTWGRGWKGTNPADKDFRVGVLDTSTRARGYVSFPVSKSGPGTVTSATLSVWKDWTGSCDNRLWVRPMKAAWSKNPTNNGFPGPSAGDPVDKEDVPCPQSALKKITLNIPPSTVQP